MNTISYIYQFADNIAYGAMLSFIVSNELDVDITAHRGEKIIRFAFDADDKDTITAISDAAKRLSAKEVSFVELQDPREDLEKQLKECEQQRDATKRENDGLKKLWADERIAKDRVLSQIQSIKTLLNGLFPEKD